MLNLEGIVSLFKPGWKLNEFILGVRTKIVSADQTASVLKDLAIYLIIGGVSFILFTLALLLGCIPRFRMAIFTKLMDFRKKFIWNGVIRSITISWMGFLLTSGT